MDEAMEAAYQSIILAIQQVRNSMETAQASYGSKFIETIDTLDHLQYALLQLQDFRKPSP